VTLERGGGKLGGAFPLLCNIQFAVARVLNVSAAVAVIAQLKEDDDESNDFPTFFLPTVTFAHFSCKVAVCNTV
jgi:hypothetical protein